MTVLLDFLVKKLTLAHMSRQQRFRELVRFRENIRKMCVFNADTTMTMRTSTAKKSLFAYPKALF